MREIVNPYIVLREHLDHQTYADIKGLQDLCLRMDRITLKLELDYKLSKAEGTHQKLGRINEFLYYSNGALIGYIGICQFAGAALEVSGMVHPDYRRQYVFKKLFALVKDEWGKRGTYPLLVLCDSKSTSGQAFIKTTNAALEHSEYEMFLTGKGIKNSTEHQVRLRKAHNGDAREIAKQNAVYFNMELGEELLLPEEEAKSGVHIYVAEVDNGIVGKVHVEVRNGIGGIYGLGVLPEYRGKGYGREILLLAIEKLREQAAKSIMLQVAAKNANALSLYKSCGFEETSVMDYYEISRIN